MLLGGWQADAAFWYEDENGEWRSNDYYSGASGAWIEQFHDEHLPDAQFGKAWEPLPLTAEQLAEAGIEEIDLGPLKRGFPHTYGSLIAGPGESFYRGLYGKPWMDEYLTRFAERLIVREGLGTDGWTDLLALSYSTLDSVGHSFGPDSRQVLDVLLRLDRRLGELLDFVDDRIAALRVLLDSTRRIDTFGRPLASTDQSAQPSMRAVQPASCVMLISSCAVSASGGGAATTNSSSSCSCFSSNIGRTPGSLA